MLEALVKSGADYDHHCSCIRIRRETRMMNKNKTKEEKGHFLAAFMSILKYFP